MLVLPVACRQPTTQEIAAIVQGSNNVQIETLQILPDNGAGQAAATAAPASVYYVVKVVYANNSTADVTPALDHFVFTSVSPHASYRALTTGFPAGVSAVNPATAVRAGDKQEYTLVFHPATGATGTIVYQP